MRKNNIFKILNWVLFGAAIIISLAAYRYLPDKVALHIGITGKMSNYVSREIASAAVPAIVLFLNIYSSSKGKDIKGVKNLFVNIIMIAAQVFMIYRNIGR